MKTLLTEDTYGKTKFKYRSYAKTTHLNILLKEVNKATESAQSVGYLLKANINNRISNILAFNPTKQEIKQLFQNSNNALYGYKSFNIAEARKD